MNKKIFNWILSVLQMALIVFSIVISHLAKTKMGVMRSLTYRNDMYNKMNLDKIVLIFLVIIVLALILMAIINYRKSKKYKVLIGFILLNICAIIFTLKINSEIIISYYVLTIATTILLFIEVIKEVALKK